MARGPDRGRVPPACPSPRAASPSASTRPAQLTPWSSRAHRPGPPRSPGCPAERVDQVLPSSTRPPQFTRWRSRAGHPFCHPPGFVERPNRLSQGNPPTCGRWTVGRLAKGVRARRDGGSLAGWPMDLRADVLPEVMEPVRAPQSARSRSPRLPPHPHQAAPFSPGARCALDQVDADSSRDAATTRDTRPAHHHSTCCPTEEWMPHRAHRSHQAKHGPHQVHRVDGAVMGRARQARREGRGDRGCGRGDPALR